ncbi:unnamed protein product [Allacma fusca]|uniref:Secreted protein n=1 Tax=Allacma fusca TaxID=39272 RepID=A0A8J2PIA4_9HEXA|nr:unnamed protein product [Allacma fusca]
MAFTKCPTIFYLTVISAVILLNGVLAAPNPEEVFLEVLDAKQLTHHCVLGFQWSGTSCVHPGCVIGYYWNGLGCVRIEGGLHPCSAAYYWNGFACIHDNVLQHCAKTFYWNGASCMRDTGLHPCILGHYWDGISCVPYLR